MLRTARQKRVLCRSCPVARVANILGDSVSLLILRDLLEKPRRFTNLELAYQGISSRTLARKLKILEQCGMVLRTPSAKHYPRVDYHVTQRGAALRPVLDAMRAYGKKYL
ncbi:helix-turn-helix transcriptional regulator [Candidatus Kaiserbacteria bacterium]|nr:helix-turn-helix transcriptional regulator [Candidatus Kaiserbacteria bacterium]